MVTAVLMLSIALSVGGNMLLKYGEVVGKESDMEHASGVEDSFLRLRTSMSALLEGQDTDTTIVNRLTMGTYGNPYLGVARSSGQMSMTPNPDLFQMTISIKTATSETTLNTVNGVIRYHINNYYFQDQTFTYLGGGTIREEYGQTVMTSAPPIFVVRSGSVWGLELRSYSMTGDSWSVSGIDTVMMSVQMDGYSDIYRDIKAGQTIVLKVDGYGEDAWADHFRGYLEAAGLAPGTDFTVIDATTEVPYITVELKTISFFQGYIGEMEVTI